MIKMKKFFAQFKSLDLWTGIEAAFGAVLTLFSIFHPYKYVSRSYTVLIFPDNTLINVGLSLSTLIAVGLESSTSDDFRIGFIEYNDLVCRCYLSCLHGFC